MILNVGTKGEVVGPAQATFIEPRVAQLYSTRRQGKGTLAVHKPSISGRVAADLQMWGPGQGRVEGLVCDVVFSRSPAVDVDVIADDCSGSSLLLMSFPPI